jgi:hypothetical protein
LLAHKKRLSVQQPVLLSFTSQVSEHELDEMLHHEKVIDSLRALRLDLATLGPGLGEQRLQMHEPNVTLGDNLIVVKANVATQGADPSTFVPLTISGQPKLYDNERICLEQVSVESPDITDPQKFSKFLEHLINPLLSLHRFDRANFALRLDEMSVKSKNMFVRGRILIGPRAPNTINNAGAP